LICLREQLWGKARNYLQDSLAEATHPSTFLALARPAEAVGDAEGAAQQFREAALGYANLPAHAVDSPIAALRPGARELAP
jgi:HemY protein